MALFGARLAAANYADALHPVDFVKSSGELD